ncbi:alpha/beta hydrolase [Bacillus sp. BGMRC 2118]|nr:alpha/beta hydrolase [Bacillus sp. BGMRC 2118]
MNQRFFLLDGEWNVVHTPDRPNGFAIFIIGDRNHFVDDSTSFWIQNAGRYTFIDLFLKNGYTVFYSNLYGANWGAPKAVTLAKRLYHIVMKNEILNDNIHLLVEGMGALTGLKLMEEMGESIRSVAMLNPCLSVSAQVRHEQENKLFFKRIVRELTTAFEWEEQKTQQKIEQIESFETYKATNPAKIWVSTDEQTYQSKELSRQYEQFRKQFAPIQLVFHVNEKRFGIGGSMLQFYEKHERSL